MPYLPDIAQIFFIVLAVVIMALVLRSRYRGKAAHDRTHALENVCEHLRPVLEHLEGAGHQIRKVGQQHPELPLEIYLTPVFDPGEVYKALNLQPPVFLSERNVLYCKEHWCELHPMK